MCLLNFNRSYSIILLRIRFRLLKYQCQIRILLSSPEKKLTTSHTSNRKRGLLNRVIFFYASKRKLRILSVWYSVAILRPTNVALQYNQDKVMLLIFSKFIHFSC